jgi:hypothetical protein
MYVVTKALPLVSTAKGEDAWEKYVVITKG